MVKGRVNRDGIKRRMEALTKIISLSHDMRAVIGDSFAIPMGRTLGTKPDKLKRRPDLLRAFNAHHCIVAMLDAERNLYASRLRLRKF